VAIQGDESSIVKRKGLYNGGLPCLAKGRGNRELITWLCWIMRLLEVGVDTATSRDAQPDSLRILYPTPIRDSHRNYCGVCSEHMVNPQLTEMLRSTLEDLEAAVALPQDDGAFSELKHSIVRSVAELAVKRDEEPSVALDESIDFTRPGQSETGFSTA
jgi:hypothetical protein